MPEYRFSVHIDAPIQHVWEVLADIEGWPRWTPSVTTVTSLDSNTVQTGNRFLLDQPKLRRARWTITEVRQGEYFLWESKSAGITTRADHLLIAEEDGVRMRLVVRQSGFLAGLAGALMGSLTRRYMSLEANGLKEACERRRR